MDNKITISSQQKQAIDFVLYCYFGNTDDPIEAAIDRAYVDMASHTLKGFGDNYKDKWECRYQASEIIKKALDQIGADYDLWFRKLCDAIIMEYKDKMKFGQAQKWVNMTMKYLCVLHRIFTAMDDKDKLGKIPLFFADESNAKKLHAPLDSYVLGELKMGGGYTWSKLSDLQYKDCKNKAAEMADDDLFSWELKNWPKWAANAKAEPDAKSYAYYVKKHDK